MQPKHCNTARVERGARDRDRDKSGSFLQIHDPYTLCSTILHYGGRSGVGFATYGVATVSRINQIIGLFCRIASSLFYRSLLQKRHIILSILLAKATPQDDLRSTVQHTATHCNTLQHTATHFNTRSGVGFTTVQDDFIESLVLRTNFVVTCSIYSTN